MAVVVETKQLVETGVASLLAGVGITLLFSIAIWGAARFSEFSRDQRPLAARGAVLIAGLALAIGVAGIVVGVNAVSG